MDVSSVYGRTRRPAPPTRPNGRRKCKSWPGCVHVRGRCRRNAAGFHARSRRAGIRALASRAELAYHRNRPRRRMRAGTILRRRTPWRRKASSDGVYRVTDVIGTSKVSWEDAAKNAVSRGEQDAARPAHRRSLEARHEGRGRQGRRLSRARPAVVQVRGLTRRRAAPSPGRKPLPGAHRPASPSSRASAAIVAAGARQAPAHPADTAAPTSNRQTTQTMSSPTKVAIVTGAGTGIGKAVALALLRRRLPRRASPGAAASRCEQAIADAGRPRGARARRPDRRRRSGVGARAVRAHAARPSAGSTCCSTTPASARRRSTSRT